MISTAIRQSQYRDETGRHPTHQSGEHVGEFTPEYCQWLTTADLEYFWMPAYKCAYVLGPRKSKVPGEGVPMFCVCQGDDGYGERAATICRLLNAECGTPVPDHLASAMSIEEAEREAAAAVRESMQELDAKTKGKA